MQMPRFCFLSIPLSLGRMLISYASEWSGKHNNEAKRAETSTTNEGERGKEGAKEVSQSALCSFNPPTSSALPFLFLDAKCWFHNWYVGKGKAVKKRKEREIFYRPIPFWRARIIYFAYCLTQALAVFSNVALSFLYCSAIEVSTASSLNHPYA